MPARVLLSVGSRILWLHVISDGLITLSYYAIPVILIYFIRKNRDLPSSDFLDVRTFSFWLAARHT